MAIHLVRAAPSLWRHEVGVFGQVHEGLIRVSVLRLDQLCFGRSVFGGITEGGPFLGWSIQAISRGFVGDHRWGSDCSCPRHNKPTWVLGSLLRCQEPQCKFLHATLALASGF